MTKPLRIVGQGADDHGHDHGTCSRAARVSVADSGVGLKPDAYRGRAAIVTLGCAKNQVDSEVMLGVLRESGFEIVSDLTTADVAIVNTCGFLESAVKEGIDAILDIAELKKSARLRKLLVAGCMVSRYGSEIKESLPEVDSFISLDDLLKVGEIAGGGVASQLDTAARPYFLYDDTTPRYLSTMPHTAYVKVAEGCDRPCTFCIIPRIRGAMRSRSIQSVLNESLSLRARGVREINLVAQDLTSYGADQKDVTLAALLRTLDQQQAMEWIRLLYAYPIGIDSELLRTIVDAPSVCNYLDLPLQHSSEGVLRVMKRPLGRYSPRRIVEFIRSEAPEIALRTTFITGFPGETEEDVRDLEDFIAQGHFANVGVFTYSLEKGTPSFEMEGHIDESEKQERRARLMLAQQQANERRLAQAVGKSFEVLIEGTHEDTDLLLVGRTRYQAPEVDGQIIINDIDATLVPQGEDESSPASAVAPGTLGTVEITEIAGYDMVGTLRAVSPRQPLAA